MRSWFSGLGQMSLLVLTLSAGSAFAADPKVLLDVSAEGVEQRLTPSWGSGDQITASRSTDPAKPGLILTIKPGQAGYPGMVLKPENGSSWDLSAYGHLEARVVNVGTKGASFALRVDNASEGQPEPWNAEQTYLQPGQADTVSVIFGHAYGHKPGYALKPNAVVGILMFTSKSDDVQTLRIERLVAAGPAGEKPPVDPNSIRTKPKDGLLLGTGVKIDPAKQIESSGGAQASPNAATGGLRIVYPASQGDQVVTFKPVVGRWDLRDASEVRIKVRNEGSTPLTPKVQVLSDSNGTDLVSMSAPLAPGREQEMVVSFAPAVIWKGIPDSGDRTSWEGQPGTGTKFSSDAVSAIRVTADHTGPATLSIKSITAAAPVVKLPDWLGKRPPVEGNWVKTFDDEFDGTTIDSKHWNITGNNFWDQTSHWSKSNVILGDGVLKLRYEKKTGYHNDDPSQKQTPYASGYMDTYGKWVQKYGYFEARMKLPQAPGLWPAFWLMPDRGAQAGEQWKRQDTANGAMEFDIMEHLTRWGPHRYNIAMHWDGYTEAHKQTGTQGLYMQTDKDGFITCGLLWLPGQVIYYCNGQEVARWDEPRISKVQSDMMFTLPTGGWDNNALDDAQLPADFVIDYVRVWQRSDLANNP